MSITTYLRICGPVEYRLARYHGRGRLAAAMQVIRSAFAPVPF
jgi:hypothetical protein